MKDKTQLRPLDTDKIANELNKELVKRRLQLERDIRESLSPFIASVFLFNTKSEVKWKDKRGQVFPVEVFETDKPYLLEEYPTLEYLLKEPEGTLRKTQWRMPKVVLTYEDSMMVLIDFELDFLISEIANEWSQRKAEYSSGLFFLSYINQLNPKLSSKGVVQTSHPKEFDHDEAMVILRSYPEFSFLKDLTQELLENAKRWKTAELFEEGKEEALENEDNRLKDNKLNINVRKYLWDPLKKEFEKRYSEPFPKNHIDRGYVQWSNLESLLREYHPWDLDMLARAIHASNNIKKWLLAGGLDPDGTKPICRASLIEPACIKAMADKGLLDPKFTPPKEMLAFLAELEANCYSNAIVTFGKNESFDLTRRGPLVLYGYEPHHKALLLHTWKNMNSAEIIERSFLDTTHPRTKLPYKEIRGYFLENTLVFLYMAIWYAD